MATTRPANLLFLLFTLIFAAIFTQGSRFQAVIPQTQKLQFSSTHKREFHLQGSEDEQWKMSSRNSRRLMIGSTAPTCTYNECRGCKYKCRAKQVPVEGNDPVNSAYHYKCVCHG